MRFKNIAITILIAIACMTVAVWAKTIQSTPKLQRWEYTVRHTQSVQDTPAILNELGREGWELVNVTHEGWAYFKRRKD